MTYESIKDLYLAKPFRPFTLKTVDGGRVYVGHPEFLAFLPDQETIFVAEEDDAKTHYLDLMNITGAEILRKKRTRS